MDESGLSDSHETEEARGPFLSDDWHRIAPLKPRRRADIKVVRQVFRGEPWHVVQDPFSGLFQRLSPSAYYLLARMDGTTSVETLWLAAFEAFPDAPPSQTEMLQLLMRLYDAGLIAADRPEDMEEAARRAARHQRQPYVMALRNPLALRLPLLDPSRFLDATAPIGRAMFSVPGALLWVGLVVTALVLAIINWSAIVESRPDRFLSAVNIGPVALAYVGVKLLHEVGHGYALRRWGGTVREMGVMFLVFFPVPYVEASEAMLLRSRWQRVVVSAAGIMVELALASLALIVWLNAEPGLLRAAAYNVMLIGGVSTLLFNGNPLLRFDGYYIFADAIDSPNLGVRSTQYFWYLVQRHILGHRDAQRPWLAPSEGSIFVVYAVLSFGYRLAILIAIALFIASEYMVLGAAVALWSIATATLLPTAKGIMFLLRNPALARIRSSAMLRAGVVVALLVLLLGVVPLPHHTTVAGQGVTPSEARIQVGTAGFVEHILASEGEAVAAGDPVIALSAPILEAQVLLAEAMLRDLRQRRAAVPLAEVAQAAILDEQIAFADRRLAALAERQDALTVRAPVAGQVHLPAAARLMGRYLAQGEAIGHVRVAESGLVRVAAPAAEADLIARDTRAVAVMRPGIDPAPLPARIARILPESTTILSSPAASAMAGPFGVALDPTDPEGLRTVQPVVEIDLEVADAVIVGPLAGAEGVRVLARFTHAPKPLALRVGMWLQQTFLRVLDD